MSEGLRKLLQEGIVKVTFTKKDGTDRVMYCTQKSDLVPKVTQTRNTPDDLMVVYDVEKEGWRSFYESSVKSFQSVGV